MVMRETLEALSSLGEPAERKGPGVGGGHSGACWACCLSAIKKAEPSSETAASRLPETPEPLRQHPFGSYRGVCEHLAPRRRLC